MEDVSVGLRHVNKCNQRTSFLRHQDGGCAYAVMGTFRIIDTAKWSYGRTDGGGRIQTFYEVHRQMKKLLVTAHYGIGGAQLTDRNEAVIRAIAHEAHDS